MRFKEINENSDDRQVFESGIHGRRIIFTNHALEKYIERYEVLSKEQILDIVKKAIRHIFTVYKDSPRDYGVHSKSTGVGFIISWRREKSQFNDDEKNHAVIVSMLPVKRQHYFAQGDISIIVEKQINLFLRETNVSREKNTCDRIGSYDGFYIDTFQGRLVSSSLKYFSIE